MAFQLPQRKCQGTLWSEPPHFISDLFPLHSLPCSFCSPISFSCFCLPDTYWLAAFRRLYSSSSFMRSVLKLLYLIVQITQNPQAKQLPLSCFAFFFLHIMLIIYFYSLLRGWKYLESKDLYSSCADISQEVRLVSGGRAQVLCICK